MDFGGSDAGSIGINYDKHEMKVINGREISSTETISLDKHGFELLPSKIDSLNIDFFNNKQVVELYYSHCADIIKDVTGARGVFAFDHNRQCNVQYLASDLYPEHV